jgi:hypothetical protein
MSKPVRVKFINKNGDWVEEICHDPSTCREHSQKVNKTRKLLAMAKDNSTVQVGSSDEVTSLNDLMSMFDDNTSIDEIEFTKPIRDDEKLIMPVSEAIAYKDQLLIEMGTKTTHGDFRISNTFSEMGMRGEVLHGQRKGFSVAEVRQIALAEKDSIEGPYYENRQIYSMLSKLAEKEGNTEVRNGILSSIEWFKENHNGGSFDEGESYPKSGRGWSFYDNGMQEAYMLQNFFKYEYEHLPEDTPSGIKKGWAKASKLVDLRVEKLESQNS